MDEFTHQKHLGKVKSNLLFGFVVILLLLLFNAGTAYWNVERMSRNQQEVARSYEILDKIQSLLTLAVDTETAARGYVITGDPAYLEPSRQIIERMGTDFAPLSQLARDPKQQELIGNLAGQIQSFLQTCRQTIEHRQRTGRAAIPPTTLDTAKEQMDAVRTTITQLQNMEQIRLNARAAESQFSSIATRITVAFSFAAVLVLLGYIYTVMAKSEVRKAELNHAYAELQRLEAMRDNLTAMLVHDLRTPLTTMLMPMEMLSSGQMGTLDPAQAEIAAMSVQGGNRLLHLINELLDISKMEAGEMKLRLDTVQVGQVADDALREVQRLDLGDAARIVRDVAEDLPLMQADQDILTRVLINLLGNALKFTPRTGTITLSARLASPRREAITPALSPQRDDAENAILFAVKDTGEGIPPDQLGKIFEKFGQVESRQAGRKMSSGLGLTFCKLAVEAHGGHVWAESVPNVGSTFFFTIPLRSASAL
jgi:signal transduction histidine kinase